MQRKVKIIILVVILSFAVVGGFLIYKLSSSNQNYGSGPVYIELSPDKATYQQGENVTITVYVNNPQDWPVPYPSRVTYQQADWACIKNVDFASNSIPTFPAHSRTLYEVYVWDQKLSNRTYAPSGNYTITASFEGLVNYGNNATCTIEIKPTTS